jgi:hypothetical protein
MHQQISPIVLKHLYGACYKVINENQQIKKKRTNLEPAADEGTCLKP